MISSVKNFALNLYPSPLHQGFAAVPVLVTIESALQCIKNFSQMCQKEENQEAKVNLSKNLANLVFFGMCAAHVIPGSHIMGSVAFAAYATFAVWNDSQADMYVSTKVVGQTILTLTKHVWEVIKIVGKPIIEAIEFIAGKIQKLTSTVFSVLSQIFNRIIPQHPMWKAVTALFLAAIIYKGISSDPLSYL